jgi:hypothetical protein
VDVLTKNNVSITGAPEGQPMIFAPGYGCFKMFIALGGVLLLMVLAGLGYGIYYVIARLLAQ